MIPDVQNYNPDASYLRELVDIIGLSQRAIAFKIGISERTFRHYLAGKNQVPYVVQFTLEVWARSKQPVFEPHNESTKKRT